jgi:Uma2 family endonuclease
MTTVTRRLLTAEEFYDWVNRPENGGKHYELERGEIIEMARPGERHGFLCGNVARILGNYTFQRGRGYVCANDTGIVWEHDPDTVRGPDVVLYDTTRRFEELNPKFAEDRPTLIVEVLSPNDKPGKVARRIVQFLNWDVALVWVVDPDDSTVTVYRPNRTPQVFDAGQELTGEDVLPDLRCRVADFFYMPGEKPAGAA